MIVLVNLDTAAARRHSMETQFAALGLAHRRVGFDGRTLAAAAIDRWSRERFGGIAFDFDVLSGAEVGCWLSHLCAWDLLRASRTLSGCAVVEDDVVLGARFAPAVEALARESPFDLVYLGTSSRNISARRRVRVGEVWVHEPLGAVCNTWGYVVSRAYVERFFATPKPAIALPIDHFLGGHARRARPRIGVLRPAVVTEHPEFGARSQIDPHTPVFRLDRWQVVQGLRRRLLGSRVGALYYALYRWL